MAVFAYKKGLPHTQSSFAESNLKDSPPVVRIAVVTVSSKDYRFSFS